MENIPLDNTESIVGMLNEMTIEEHTNLLTKSFDELWEKLWHCTPGTKYRNEELLSKDRFNQIKKGVTIQDKVYTLKSLINYV